MDGKIVVIIAAILLLRAPSTQAQGMPVAAGDERTGMRFRTHVPYNEGALVPFRTALPSLKRNAAPPETDAAARLQKNNGSYNNEEMGMPGLLTSSDTRLGEMIHQLRNSIWDDRRLVFVDGRKLMCSKNWIRDHVHEMKAFRHWEYDLTSFIDFLVDTQRADGCFFELVKQYDDYHWRWVNDGSYVIYPEDNMTLVRLDIESDIEYLMVEGAAYAYKACGDDAWLARVLPALEKGMDYLTSDPWRWDREHRLVKRGYTIDTWDFTNVPDAQHNRRMEPGTPMAVMHGDNSGAWQAMNQLAWMNRRLGNEAAARKWEKRADRLKADIFRHLWNGRFFIHELPLGCEPYDAHENERLSLSNTYDINRGLTDVKQSRSIIEEYMARRDTTEAFAEWFSIDPPYDIPICGHKPGRYVNGAISPFTAGELAKAALNNGYEAYGWDIIDRMCSMMERDGDIYFLYSPTDGTPQGGGPSAWGAAALLSAIDEALCGIVDSGVKYSEIEFSPRLPVTGYKEARYMTGYEKSGVVVDMRYILADNGLRYRLASPARTVRAHIMLPEGRDAGMVRLNGHEVPFRLSETGSSRYADIVCQGLDGVADIEIIF